MKLCRALLMLNLCCFGAGCSLARTATHNVCQIPREWWQDRLEDEHNLTLAREAWQQASGATGGRADTAFMDGFLDGYADYLKYGGNGEPPALPPPKLRRERRHVPRAAAESWFAGFRLGANWARSSGQRMNVVYPVAGGIHPCAGDPYAVVGAGPCLPPIPAPTQAPTPPPYKQVIPSPKISVAVPVELPFPSLEANPRLGRPQSTTEDDAVPVPHVPEMRLTPQLRQPVPAAEETDG